MKRILTILLSLSLLVGSLGLAQARTFVVHGGHFHHFHHSNFYPYYGYRPFYRPYYYQPFYGGAYYNPFFMGPYPGYNNYFYTPSGFYLQTGGPGFNFGISSGY
jgi:hypothetical protein